MLDIQFIREHPDLVKEKAAAKKASVDIDALLLLDTKRRELLKEREELNSLKNDINELIQKAANDAERQEVIAKGKEIKAKLETVEPRFREAEKAFEEHLAAVPNLPSEDTPEGPDESGNQVLRSWGEKPAFSFTPREHSEIGALVGGIDNETAGTVSGARFTYLMGDVALLQFALLQFALGVLTNANTLEEIATRAGIDFDGKTFLPVIPPVFIRPEVLQKMDRLEPKDDRYYIASDDQYLTGSAEHALGPLHMDALLEESDLPLRYAGYSTAFRREAGSYGKDTKGILRMHQFDKLEIESFSLPENGQAEQEFIVAIQEYLMQALELPYQVVLVCTGDMGKPDFRQIDIETWMPGQGRYRETHSADYVTDYQARRLKTRVRRADGRTELVHMNDATVFAIGRTLIAILENYQEEDGAVRVPKVLQAALGKERIALRGN
jgi:seryl-tRNA synthetase